MNKYIIKSNDMIREIVKDARGVDFFTDRRDVYLVRVLRDLYEDGTCSKILAKSGDFNSFFVVHLAAVSARYINSFGFRDSDPVAHALIEWLKFVATPVPAVAA